MVMTCPAGREPTSTLREARPFTLIVEPPLLTATSVQTLCASAFPLLLTWAVIVREKPPPLISVMTKPNTTLPPGDVEGDRLGAGVGLGEVAGLELGVGVGVVTGVGEGICVGAGVGIVAGDVFDPGSQPKK